MLIVVKNESHQTHNSLLSEPNVVNNVKVNTFALELWDDQCKYCTFYTVRNHYVEGEDKNNETDKFFDKYESDPMYSESASVLLSFIIDAIGDTHGPIDELLNRDENEGLVGLPNQGKAHLRSVLLYYPRFKLRLYAFKINDRILILFNGGIKDGETNQTSSLNLEWHNALIYAKRIKQALLDGEIIVNGRVLKSHDGSNTIII